MMLKLVFDKLERHEEIAEAFAEQFGEGHLRRVVCNTEEPSCCVAVETNDGELYWLMYLQENDLRFVRERNEAFLARVKDPDA